MFIESALERPLKFEADTSYQISQTTEQSTEAANLLSYTPESTMDKVKVLGVGIVLLVALLEIAAKME
tara:strand:+ start:62 stop:265 length:204 start_codon:yes stop_codon:yes gene_type:complete